MKKLFLLLSLFLASESFAQYSTRHVYSDTAVSTGTWQVLSTSTPYGTANIQIFDSSGQTMSLGIGAIGAEQQVAIIPPGGDFMQVTIPRASRVSIKAISSTASAGENIINFFKIQ